MRVSIYAVILKDIWARHQKGLSDTRMRHRTDSYMILEPNEGNREEVSCDVAFGIEQQAWQQYSVLSGAFSVIFLGASALQAARYNSFENTKAEVRVLVVSQERY